ncbi:hypothetical protein LJ739_06735 [Aestuariibacter halophilus]|uniref:Uncharacterized protein n=1 Tax=Fluctibacter halophilus TaxID=226011 RepID=A0ABS8G5P9_9ALTE|nr:hypothetical protein [Aestuariibacter halophilus]MCC2615932.1 hypothetical protein [Aestuariibacter halophilus]
MTTQLKSLAIDTALAAVAAPILEPEEGTAVFIGSAVFTNTGSAAETVTIWRLGNGTASSATNYLAKKTILPGKSWLARELIGVVIEGGQTVEGSDTAGNVQVNISGTLTTND